MKNIMIFIAIICGSIAQAQVGINNPNPDPSALLDLNSNEKGLLIPRMRTAERTLISSPATGLLVFDTDEQRFYFYNGSTWIALNEMRRTAASSDVTHTGNLTLTGTVSATNYGLNPSGNGPIPQGGIIMWSGSSPPTGWALCNGGNGTPDLRGRFIVGFNPSDTDYNQPGNRSSGGGTNGETGGAESVALSINQMPSHNHGIGSLAISGGSHTHGLNLGGGSSGPRDAISVDAAPNATSNYGPEETASASHTHTISGSTANAGSNQAHENRPPYYVLAFIMKL